MSEKEKRIVHVEDALTWLKNQNELTGCSLVASLPDISEFGSPLVVWKEWFVETAKLILSKTPDDGVSVFFQSDIKLEGRWIDKGFLVQKAAEQMGFHQLFHKIVCRVAPNHTTPGRPTYSHLLCFAKTLSLEVAKSSADVLSQTGEKTWERGMGLDVSLFTAKFIQTQTCSHTIVNPFCGEGSMLAAANFHNLHAIGIERSPKRARKAEALIITPEKRWSSKSSLL